MSAEARRDLACVLLLIALALSFFWRAAFTGKVLLPADLILIMTPWRDYSYEHFPKFLAVENPMIDPVTLFYPWRAQAKETMAEGHLPLWNPNLLCGTPLAANHSSAVWYPPNVLFYLLPLATAWTWVIILHFAMAGAFMFLFLRGVGANRAGSMLAAVAWMLNGWHVAWAEYQTIVSVLVWLPLVLLCAERALTRRHYGWAIGGGAAYAMQFLAGHAQYALFSTFLILAYCVFRIVSLRGEHRDRSRATLQRVGLCAVLFAVAGLIAAIQTLPSAELARVNHRRGAFDYETVHDAAVPLKQLGTLFSPNLWGGWGEQEYTCHPYQGKGSWLEYSAYVGLAPLLLALVGAFVVRKWHARFFGVLALVVLLIALGTPLMWLFYHVFPGATQMPSITRILSLWVFCVAVLAGLATSRLAQWAEWGSERRLRRHLIDGSILVLLVVFVVLLAPKSHPLIPDADWADFALVQMAIAGLLFLVWRAVVWLGTGGRSPVCAWLLVGVTAVDLLWFFSGWNPAKDRAMLYPETGAIRAARAIADGGRIVSLPDPRQRGFGSDVVPNMGLLFGFREVQGADSLFYKRTKEFWNTIRYGHPEDPEGSIPNEVRFTEPPPADLLAWLDVRCVITPRDDLGPEDDLRPIRRLGDMFLYEPEPPPDAGSEWTAMADQIASWRTPSANEHLFELGAGAVGEVALPVSFYPGWRAEVDGAAAELRPSHHAFCGLTVPPGARQVRLEYRPASFAAGAFLTLVGIAFCLGAAVFAGVFRAQKPV